MFYYDSEEDILDSKYNLHDNIISTNNVNEELNIISADEALVLNESKIKRRLIINIVKKNSAKYIPVLKKALENDDIEVSHYAAVAITEFKNHFINTLQKESEKYKKNKKDINTLKRYVNALKNYIDSDLLDEKSLINYRNLYSEKLEELLSLHTSEEKYFIDKINCHIELSEYNLALKYCNRFTRIHNKSKKPYIMYMKVYYMLKDIDNFKIKLNYLNQSAAKLDNTTLNMLRFWQKGDI